MKTDLVNNTGVLLSIRQYFNELYSRMKGNEEFSVLLRRCGRGKRQ